MRQHPASTDDARNDDSRFRTTHWSLVLAAAGERSPQNAAALETLCRTYWFPLYAYARRRAADAAEAQDLTQAFFVELLEKNYLGAATPERGRFRAFLLAAFKHFLSKQRQKARALKRGGGRRPLSLDFAAADARLRLEPCAGLTPEQLYERQWAVTLLAQLLGRLEAEFGQAGKANEFQQLKGFVVGDHAGRSYADAAASLGTTEAAARMAAHRMRRRYQQLLREEIAGTVASPDQVDDEIRNLRAALEL